MKLSKKAANDISAAINSMLVAKTMLSDGYSKIEWMKHHDEAAKKLIAFGIRDFRYYKY